MRNKREVGEGEGGRMPSAFENRQTLVKEQGKSRVRAETFFFFFKSGNSVR